MRRPIKPFAVEKRRSGRRIPLPDLLDRTVSPAESPVFAARPAPEPEDDSYLAALRAADALFSKEPAHGAARVSTPEDAPAGTPAEQRRILPNLTEEDPIARMLAEAEAQNEQRRRGRPRRAPASANAPQLELAELDMPGDAPAPAPLAPLRIPGYVRGLILARYVRNDAPRPGERWRKHKRSSP